jgi:hypothetical protein
MPTAMGLITRWGVYINFTNSCISVGDVLEEVFAVGIPKGPDIRLSAALRLICRLRTIVGPVARLLW